VIHNLKGRIGVENGVWQTISIQYKGVISGRLKVNTNSVPYVLTVKLRGWPRHLYIRYVLPTKVVVGPWKALGNIFKIYES
jgi:hypothetical protein